MAALQSPLTFKASLGDDLRRWSQPEESASYDEIAGRIASAFSVLKTDMLLRYQDEDQDWITVTSDADLLEAIAVAKQCAPEGTKTVLRLEVISPKPLRPGRQTQKVPKIDLSEMEEAVSRLDAKAKVAAAHLDKESKKAAKEAKKAAARVDKEAKKAVKLAEKAFKHATTAALGAMASKDVSDAFAQAAASLPESAAPFAQILSDVAVALTPRTQSLEAPTVAQGSPVVPPPHVHHGVACDMCDMAPILGPRYAKKDADVDLCAADFAKLSAEEAAQFTAIEHPLDEGCWKRPPSVHPNVECDVSGMFPLVGPRYSKKNCNYDLCEEEFLKLPEEEQMLYERIAFPGACPVDLAQPSTVEGELAARHGWTPQTMQGLADCHFAELVEQLQGSLSQEQFEQLAAAIEPVFALDPERLEATLAALEPYLALVPAELDLLPDYVAMLLAEQSGPEPAKSNGTVECQPPIQEVLNFDVFPVDIDSAAEEAARVAAEEEAACAAAEKEAARMAAEEAACVAAEKEAARMAAEEAACVAAEKEAARVAAEEEAARVAAEEEAACVITQSIVQQLVAMGFEQSACLDAVKASGDNIETAITFLLEAPAAAEPEPEPAWDAEWDDILAELKEMGFEDETTNMAMIKEKEGDIKETVKELVKRERVNRQC